MEVFRGRMCRWSKRKRNACKKNVNFEIASIANLQQIGSHQHSQDHAQGILWIDVACEWERDYCMRSTRQLMLPTTKACLSGLLWDTRKDQLENFAKIEQIHEKQAGSAIGRTSIMEIFNPCSSSSEWDNSSESTMCKIGLVAWEESPGIILCWRSCRVVSLKGQIDEIVFIERSTCSRLSGHFITKIKNRNRSAQDFHSASRKERDRTQKPQRIKSTTRSKLANLL